MESLSSAHNSRFYLIPPWMKCQFPRFEQSEWDLSNALQTLTHGVTSWNPRDISQENHSGRRYSWCTIKITEFHLHSAQMARTSGLWRLHKITLHLHDLPHPSWSTGKWMAQFCHHFFACSGKRVPCDGEIVNSHFHCRAFPNNIRSKAQKNKVQIVFKSLLRRDANTFILEKSLEMHACTSHIV